MTETITRTTTRSSVMLVELALKSIAPSIGTLRRIQERSSSGLHAESLKLSPDAAGYTFPGSGIQHSNDSATISPANSNITFQSGAVSLPRFLKP